MRTLLSAPPGFSFRRTVLSHGWCFLPPFTLEDGARALSTVARLRSVGATRLRMTEVPGGVELTVDGAVPARAREEAAAAASRILAFAVDLSELHERVRDDPQRSWIASTGSGRLLRSPTAFEDLVKLLLTTNCSWAATSRMARTMTERWGEPAADGGRAFPGAEAIADAGEARLRDEARTGYRASSLAALATEVSGGRIDPESWERPDRPVAEIRREMLALPGVGPYVAENMLKLLGRPDGLGLDSWMRKKYARLVRRKSPVPDATLARRYARFGRWGGVVLWLDLTRDEIGEGDPRAAWESLA